MYINNPTETIIFLSTLSLRRATVGQKRLRQKLAISIHALLAESDRITQRDKLQNKNFYPRSPCGERLMHALIFAHSMLFLSTLSLRRATIGLVFLWWGVRFLSTLSLRRATVLVLCSCGGVSDFYPRSPCGERPILLTITVFIHTFLSTLSLRRATFEKFEGVIAIKISIHALLAESDPD